MQVARLHSQLNAETVGAKSAHLHVRYESRSEEDHRAVGPTMGASTERQILVKMGVPPPEDAFSANKCFLIFPDLTPFVLPQQG